MTLHGVYTLYASPILLDIDMQLLFLFSNALPLTTILLPVAFISYIPFASIVKFLENAVLLLIIISQSETF